MQISSQQLAEFGRQLPEAQQPGAGGGEPAGQQPWWLAVRPTQANAGDQVSVEVTGERGAPVAAVVLEITGPAGGVTTLTTDAEGRAAFAADAPGDWRVQTVGSDVALRAVLPIRPETPPGTGLWLVPALVLGLLVVQRLVRRRDR